MINVLLVACQLQKMIKKRPEYVKGISCHHCYDKVTEKQKARFAEREKQSQLAAEKGFSHVGDEAKKLAQLNKQKKQQAKEAARKKAQQ